MFSFIFWNTSIATIPTYALGPTTIFFSFPGWSKGTIGIIAWLIMINNTTLSIVHYIRNKLGYTPPPPETWLSKIMNVGKSFIQPS